jgi:hypothetical protein
MEDYLDSSLIENIDNLLELPSKEIDKYLYKSSINPRKIMEKQRRRLVTEKNILEAENLRSKISELRRTKVLKDQKSSISDKRTKTEEIYNINVEDIENKYNEKIEKLNEKTNAAVEKLIEKHEKDIESFTADFEKRFPKPNNNNVEITNLKKIMDMLIRQKKFEYY